MDSPVGAAVDNRRMVESLGINIGRLFTITFAFGSGMAALGGGLGAEFLGLDPQYPLKYLVMFLIVVAVGGLGRITGVFYASLIIGVLDFALKKYLPQGGTVFIYGMTIAGEVVFVSLGSRQGSDAWLSPLHPARLGFTGVVSILQLAVQLVLTGLCLDLLRGEQSTVALAQQRLRKLPDAILQLVLMYAAIAVDFALHYALYMALKEARVTAMVGLPVGGAALTWMTCTGGVASTAPGAMSPTLPPSRKVYVTERSVVRTESDENPKASSSLLTSAGVAADVSPVTDTVSVPRPAIVPMLVVPSFSVPVLTVKPEEASSTM